MTIYKALPETPAKTPRVSRRSVFFVVFAFVFSATLSYLFTRNPEDTSATLAGFSAGNIINDYTMGNYTTMTEAQIQAFLNSKDNCSTRGKDYYDYLVDTYNNKKGKPTSTHSWHFENGHFVCLAQEKFGEKEGEFGSGETAAHIIWQAAQDYKINPQVLLVTLQKEQALLTDSIPRSGQYNSAMGFGCYDDNQGCRDKYAGFKKQIRSAASLYHEVITGGWSNFTVGVNYVRFSPDENCGGSNVNIENLATAALYRYTPYQPNAATLAAGTGTAYCGAYGNRNFYNYFTDWFGSTQAQPNVISNIYFPDGEYVIKSALNNKYSLDVHGGDNAEGANIQLWTSNDSAAQRFTFNYDTNTKLYTIKTASGKNLTADSVALSANVIQSNSITPSCTSKWAIQSSGDNYIIMSACSGAVLDLNGGTLQNSTNISVWPSNGGNNQKWKIVKNVSSKAPTEALSAGLYSIQTTNGLSLDVYGGSHSQNANIEIWDSHLNSNQQKYYLEPGADGFYTIMDYNSNLYIDVNGAKGINGTNVATWPKSNSCAQKWLLEKDGNNYHILSSCDPNKALDIAGARLKRGTNVQIWDKNTSAAQDWQITPTKPVLEEGKYRIVSSSDTNKSLDVYGLSTTAGTRIQLWSNNDSGAQSFQISRSKDGYYTIKNLVSNLYVDVYGAIANNGTQIQQWTGNTSCAQKWELQSENNNTYRFVSACSPSFSLDLYSGQPKDGQKIELWVNNNSAAQKWKLVAL